MMQRRDLRNKNLILPEKTGVTVGMVATLSIFVSNLSLNGI